MHFLKKHILAFTILVTTLGIGFIVFGDYGIAWDEPLQRDIGLKSYEYIRGRDKTLNDFKNRDYGVAVELPLVIMEKALQIKDTRDIFRFRHITMHLFFLLCAFSFYLLIYYLYRNRLLALTGYLMLLLSPRIYAQSFYNSKDIPFLCMFILSFLTSAIAFRKKKLKYFILFGIISGLLINIRIMGIIIPVFTTLMMAIDLYRQPGKKKIILNYLFYLSLTVGVLYLSWPWLWHDPVGRFSIAFTNMSKFRWDNPILFMGELVYASKISWLYFPQWFGFTTPILYLLIGIAGFALLFIKVILEPFRFISNTSERNTLLYTGCFLLPVFAVIFLHSVLYDSWRQLYFVYPAFLLLAIYCLSHIMKFPTSSPLSFRRGAGGEVPLNSKAGGEGLLNSRAGGELPRKTTFPRILFLLVLTGSFAGTLFTMIKSHPFEDVYFNILLSKDNQYLRKTFELDYWGTSYKQALEYIVSHDKSTVLNIRVANLPGEHNSMILKPEDRKRIRYVESDANADYYITNYRWHPKDYPYPKDKKIFSISVQNSEICTIWKLH